jgi:hypothetical protein
MGFNRLKYQQFSVTIEIGRVSPPHRLQMFMFPHDFHWTIGADELDKFGRAAISSAEP